MTTSELICFFVVGSVAAGLYAMGLGGLMAWIKSKMDERRGDK